MSHLDWSNTRYFDVYLSFDGGANWAFYKRFYTYRPSTDSSPYTSSIYTIATNLPLNKNVRVRIVATRGRVHFEGFGLLKYDVGDSGPTNQYVTSARFVDGDNPSLYVDPNSTSKMVRIDADIFYDRNNTSYYVNPASTSYLNDVRANIFYDRNNTSFYVDPASTSILRYARADIFYDRNNTGYYVDPASTSILYMVRADRFYDRNNTSYYVDPASTSYVNDFRANIVYDRNNTACFFNGYGTTRLSKLEAREVISTLAVRAPDAVFGQALVGGVRFGGNSLVPNGGDYWWGFVGTSGRRFRAMYAGSFNTSSSIKVKRDVQDLGEEDLEWALQKIRAARSVRFRYKWEASDPVEGDRLAKEGRGGYRPKPHIGVIAETLPEELTLDERGEFSGGYNLSDMDGLLLAAIKALDRENQELKARVEVLEDAMVRAGLLK